MKRKASTPKGGTGGEPQREAASRETGAKAVQLTGELLEYVYRLLELNTAAAGGAAVS